MGHAVAFDQAVTVWKQQPEDDNDATFDAVAKIEALILSHRPRSLGESVAMLDLIISEYDCGPRCDELDRKALKAVREWLDDEDRKTKLHLVE